MNRWKTFAVAALVTGALLGEQHIAAAQVVLGAKVGVTFSTLSVEDDNTEQSRLMSFGGGGFLRFGVGGLSLQPELLAVTKGSRIEDVSGLDVKLKLDYIDVPVFLRFGLGQGAFTPYVMVGPSFGFDIGCTVEASDGDSDVSADCEEDPADSFERTKLDIGLAGALGFEFKAGPGNILVEGRYTHGFTDIAKDEAAKIKNRSFGVFAGYAISLGTRR